MTPAGKHSVYSCNYHSAGQLKKENAGAGVESLETITATRTLAAFRVISVKEL